MYLLVLVRTPAPALRFQFVARTDSFPCSAYPVSSRANASPSSSIGCPAVTGTTTTRSGSCSPPVCGPAVSSSWFPFFPGFQLCLLRELTFAVGLRLDLWNGSSFILASACLCWSPASLHKLPSVLMCICRSFQIRWWSLLL